MEIITDDRLSDFRTEQYYFSPVCRSVIDRRANSVTLHYRNGHTVTHTFHDQWQSGCRISPDGSRLYYLNTDRNLCCHAAGTFRRLWTYRCSGIPNVYPTERGAILLEYHPVIEDARQTDENGREFFDKTYVPGSLLTLLDAETGRILVRRSLTGYLDSEDLTHDHLLIQYSDDTIHILRKSDLSPVCETKTVNMQVIPLYIINGKPIHYRTIRAYGSLYNYEETEIPLELPKEVLRSAEIHAGECEEYRRILMEENPPYDFLDPRLHGIVDAEGNITDLRTFSEYTGLHLIPYRTSGETPSCFLCGGAVSEGYSTIDARKIICTDCRRTFRHALTLITVFGLNHAEEGESIRYEERLRNSRTRQDHSTGSFEEFHALSEAGGYIRITRKMKDGTSDEWFLHADSGGLFPEWVQSFRDGLGNTVQRITIAVLPEDTSSDHSLFLDMTHESVQYTAYPPIPSADKEAAEIFRNLLPNYRDAGLETNPFAPFCTEFTLNALWSMTKEIDKKHVRLDLFDRFAKAAYAQGARSLYIHTPLQGSDFPVAEPETASNVHAYRILLSVDGADINENLRAAIGCSGTSVVLAENLGAVIYSRFGYAAAGGTPGLMKNVRRPLEISDFMNDYYIFYQPDNREFYRRKRALVTWATASAEYPEGQYDLLLTRRLRSENRTRITDD